MKLNAGMLLYKYQLQHRIGRGHFGEVWLAKDRTLDRDFAVKVLKPGTPVHHRLKESQVGHGLIHENLVRTHHADVLDAPGEQEPVVFIAMDYLSQGPITSIINEARFLPLPKAMAAVIDVLRGLEHLHQLGYIHNDVKPANILIADSGASMLTDYGIVEVATNGHSSIPPKIFYGLHAAPEVITGGVITEQTDVFQVGLTLLRLLVGLDALRNLRDLLGKEGYQDAVIRNKLVSKLDLPSYVPKRLMRVVRKALQPNLENRYASALEMRRALEGLHFAGSWTVVSGELRGRDGRYEYWYVWERVGSRKAVTAYRRHLVSGKESRVRKYCVASQSESEVRQRTDEFIRGVVEGL